MAMVESEIRSRINKIKTNCEEIEHALKLLESENIFDEEILQTYSASIMAIKADYLQKKFEEHKASMKNIDDFKSFKQ